jgi:hypothetical protein
MRLRACGRLSVRPLTGHWFRAIRLKHWNGRLSTDHSRSSSSRFSAAGPASPLYRVLYLGETHQVAIHEVGALLGDPVAPIPNPHGSWAILSLYAVLDNIVDLSDRAQQRIIGTNDSELTGNWVNTTGVAPTQQLGQALHDLPEVEGVIYRSSKLIGRCLVIFPDKLGARSYIDFENEMTGKHERLI